MMALAILILRYTEPEKREWKVPGNIPLGNGRELPVGIILIASVLFLTALVNFFTKYQATIGGISFSLLFFAIFTYSERRANRLRAGKPEGLDQFRVYGNEEPATETLGVRAGNARGEARLRLKRPLGGDRGAIRRAVPALRRAIARA